MTEYIQTIDGIFPDFCLKSHTPALTGLTLRESVELTMFNEQVLDKLYRITVTDMQDKERLILRSIQSDLYNEIEIIEEALKKSNELY